MKILSGFYKIMNNLSQTTAFSKWRERFWPIHSFEIKKLLPLILMKFFISLVYSILTCMKDTLVVTANGSGPEVIPVLKGWIVLPCAIFATILYAKLANVFKRSTLFYGTIGTLVLILTLYGFVLYLMQTFYNQTKAQTGSFTNSEVNMVTGSLFIDIGYNLCFSSQLNYGQLL